MSENMGVKEYFSEVVPRLAEEQAAGTKGTVSGIQDTPQPGNRVKLVFINY